MTAEREPTRPKQAPNDGTPWKPGESGNPAGRPKGSKNKLGEQFLTAMQQDFEKHGVSAIVTVREEKPAEYLKVIAGLLPKDVNLNVNGLEDLTDDQLLSRIRQLDATIKPFLTAHGLSEGEGAVNDRAGTETQH